MVFCGKPSKGCDGCRVRRIKCDQVEPECSQCLRAGKECYGYRDQLTLLFRDENERVIRKAAAPKKTTERRKTSKNEGKGHSTNCYDTSSVGSRREVGSPTSTTSSTASSSLVRNITALNTRPLTPPHVDEGIEFFFTHYVSIITTLPSGQLNLCSSPLWPELFNSQLFFNGVSSVGFAGLANVTKNKSHMIMARQKYARTLLEIGNSLKDTSTADLDATFKAVMLLTAFEIVNGTTKGSGRWGIHITGGEALLKLMAPKEPHTPAVRMQFQFCFSAMVKCLSKGEPCSDAIADWSKNCAARLPPEDAPAADLAGVIIRFVNLYASIKNSYEYQHAFVTSDDLFETSRTVQEALAIDAELEQWELSLPPSWRFITARSPDDSDIYFSDKCHIYQNLWSARIWNNYRWARIMVNEILLVHMASLGSFPYDGCAQRVQYLQTINRMATDICCSASSQFSGRNNLQEQVLTKVPPISGCFLLLFPLAVSGSAMGVSEELHEWVLSMLEKIGNEMGIMQALTMIDPTRDRRASWCVEKEMFDTRGVHAFHFGSNLPTGPDDTLSL